MSYYSRDAINVATLKQALSQTSKTPDPNIRDESGKVRFFCGEQEFIIEEILDGTEFRSVKIQLIQIDKKDQPTDSRQS